MADKQERLKRDLFSIFTESGEAYALTFGGDTIHTTKAKKLRIERADLFIALHNAAIDINPSNPMAVAENMDTAFRALILLDSIAEEKAVRSLSRHIQECIYAYTDKARPFLAAITKPKGD